MVHGRIITLFPDYTSSSIIIRWNLNFKFIFIKSLILGSEWPYTFLLNSTSRNSFSLSQNPLLQYISEHERLKAGNSLLKMAAISLKFGWQFYTQHQTHIKKFIASLGNFWFLLKKMFTSVISQCHSLQRIT